MAEEATTFLAMDGKPIQINGWFFNRDYWKKPLTLTLETDGHGTLTADTVSGYAGDTVELSTAYNTYYRFSGYDVTGGTISNNTFTFGDEDATVYAAFKPNAFTATGSFNFGTLSFNWNGQSTSPRTASKVGNAIVNGFTGGRPSDWPANGAAWNVSNASAYSVKSTTTWSYQTVAKGRFNCTGTIRIGNTSKVTITGYVNSNTTTKTAACNMSPNSTQGLLNAYGAISANTQWNEYRIWLSTNSWSATGYAP